VYFLFIFIFLQEYYRFTLGITFSPKGTALTLLAHEISFEGYKLHYLLGKKTCGI